MWALVLGLSCAPSAGTDTGVDDDEPRRWSYVAQGAWEVCAIDTQGVIDCMPPLEHEIVDDCYTADLSNPPIGNYVSVVMTHPLGFECAEVACARRTEGGIDCWGWSDYHSDIDYSLVHPSTYDSCGLDPTGARRCWSASGSVYFPDREGVVAFASSALDMVEVDNSGITTRTSALDGDTAILETGGAWTRVEMSWEGLVCGLHVDGSVSCAIDGEWAGAPAQAPAPRAGPFTDLCAAATQDVCALREDGSPECWSADAEVDAPAGPFTQITCGTDSFCGLTPKGAIECWGDCDSGECRVPK